MSAPEQGIVDRVTAYFTYGGSSTAVVSGLTAEWIGVIGGLAVGLAGYFTKLYYDRKRDKREEEEHEARMRSLEP